MSKLFSQALGKRHLLVTAGDFSIEIDGSGRSLIVGVYLRGREMDGWVAMLCDTASGAPAVDATIDSDTATP